MPTGVDFVLQNRVANQFTGAGTRTGPFVMALDPVNARGVAGRVPGGASGQLAPTGRVNNGNFLLEGFSNEAFAKNGAFHVTTSGTTAVTCDLTNLALNATSSAGDLTFANWNKIRIYNCGTADMTYSPGGSNPANLGLGGTTPTHSIPAGSAITIERAAGNTVDATHKNITITPSAGGDVVIAVGGS